MISVYKIKPAFQKLLHPLIKNLRMVGVTPNQITIAAIILSAIMGFSFLYHQQYPIILLLIPSGYLVRMALNALDGMMASKYNLKSDLGEILNELGDVISDTFIFLPFLIVPKISISILVSFIVLSIINEYAGILGKVISGTRRYEGPMGKSDRALVISLYCIVMYFWYEASTYINWIFGFCSLLIIISTLARIRNTLAEKS